MAISDLIDRHGIISDQVDRHELRIVLEQLEKALAKDGAVVEFGCYTGTTSLYLRRLLDLHEDTREFHVYDSFEGLPEKTHEDQSPVGEQFRPGELSVSKKQFLREFQKAHLRPPIVHKGWFADLAPDDIPDQVAFAFLDGDYYDSIKQPLKLLGPRLAPGAVIVVDDYGNEALPGAARAVDEWAKARGCTVRMVHTLAILTL